MKLIVILLTSTLVFSQSIKENLKSFTRLDLELNCNIEIIFADEHKIEVKGSEKNLDGIEIEVNGRTLHIGHERNHRGMGSFFDGNNIRNRMLDVVLHVKKLNKIELNGEGKAEIAHFVQDYMEIESKGDMRLKASGEADEMEIKNIGPGSMDLKNIRSEDLDISNVGPGNIRISGKTDRLDVNIIGPGDVLAFDLETERLDAKIIGPGDLKITVLDRISAKFIGPGNVVYKGNPEDVSDSGIGPGEVRRY